MRFRFQRWIVLVALASILGSANFAPASSLAQTSVPPATDVQLVSQLQQATGGQVRISYHARTGKVRFLGTTQDHPIARAANVAASASPETAARGFLAAYGQIFGLRDQASELQVLDQHAADRARSVVKFQQVFNGVPVVTGELVINLDGARNVLSANGAILPGLNLDTTPHTTPAQARQEALQLITKQYPAARLNVSAPQLWLHNPLLPGWPGLRMSTLVWRMDVTATNGDPIRELVLIDAQTGKVVLHFNQIADALQRHVCDDNDVVGAAETCSSTSYVRSEGQGPTGIKDVDFAYDLAGVTYNFYLSHFNRDSLDGKGMPLLSMVRYCPDATNCPFANAYWNGTQMTYGKDLASADDVAGHEMTHGVTEFTSHLMYYYQSGAINESFSDVFGETIDQLSKVDSVKDASADRWWLAEDLPAGIFFDCNSPDGGSLRYMKDPTRCGQPDRVLSSKYAGTPDDSGGVHTNSGVGNKAYYLAVDGGTFNGITVSPMGSLTLVGGVPVDSLNKAIAVWYEAETNLMSSGTDYQDLHDYLYQACLNLVGQKPYGATSAITTTNCSNSIQRAADATEMAKQPPAVSNPEAQVCDRQQVPTDLFMDDLENPASGNWTTTKTPSTATGWYYPQNANNPYYPSIDFTYARSGQYNFWGDDPGDPQTSTPAMDASIALTRDIVVPTGKQTYLHFDHAYEFESGYIYDANFNQVEVGYDGGVVEYSVVTNGVLGPWTPTDALPSVNGPNDIGLTIPTTFSDGSSNPNPLKGRKVFSGIYDAGFGFGTDFSSDGYLSTRFDLSSLAGKTIRFRFRIGSDNYVGERGWYVDDVRAYTCGTAPIDPTPPNVLKNTGFEYDWNNDTFIDSWTSNDRFTRSPSLSHTGMFSGQLSDTANSNFTVSQVVTNIVAGHPYAFTGYVNIPTTTDTFTLKTKLQWMSAANVPIGSPVLIAAQTTHTGGNWILQSKSGMVPPSGAVHAAIQLVASSWNLKAYVDDFVLQ